MRNEIEQTNIILINANEILDNIYENDYSFEGFYDKIEVDKYSGFFYNLKNIKKTEMRNFLSFFGGSALIIADNKFLIKLGFFLGLFKNESFIYLILQIITVDELYNILMSPLVSYNVLYILIGKFNKRIILEIYRYFLIFNKKKKISYKKFKNEIIRKIYLYDSIKEKELYKYYMYLDSKNFFKGDLRINFLREFYYQDYFIKNFFLEMKSFYEIIMEFIHNLIKSLYNILLTNNNYYYSFEKTKLELNYYKIKKQKKIENIMVTDYYYYFHEFISIIRIFVYYLLKETKIIKVKNYIKIFEKKINLFLLYLMSKIKQKEIIFFFYKIYFYIKNEIFFNILEKRKDKIYILLKKLNYFFLIYIQKIRIEKLVTKLNETQYDFNFIFNDYLYNLFLKNFSYKRMDQMNILFDFHMINFEKKNKKIIKILKSFNYSFENKYNLLLLLNKNVKYLVYFLNKRTVDYYKEKKSEFFIIKIYNKIFYYYNVILFNIYNYQKPLYIILIEIMFKDKIYYKYLPSIVRIASQIEYFFDLISNDVILEGYEDFEQDVFFAEHAESTVLEDEVEEFEDLVEFDFFEDFDLTDIPLFEYFNDLSSINYYTMETYIQKYGKYEGMEEDDIEKEGISYLYDYYNDNLSPFLNRKLNFDKYKIQPSSWYLWIQVALIKDLTGFTTNYYDVEMPLLFNFINNNMEEKIEVQKSKLSSYIIEMVIPIIDGIIDRYIDNEKELITPIEQYLGYPLSNPYINDKWSKDQQEQQRKEKKGNYVKKKQKENKEFLRKLKKIKELKKEITYLKNYKDKNRKEYNFNIETLKEFHIKIKEIIKLIKLEKKKKEEEDILNDYLLFHNELEDLITENYKQIINYPVKGIDYTEDNLYTEYNIHDKNVEILLGLYSFINEEDTINQVKNIKNFMLLNESWVWWNIIKKANNINKFAENLIPENIEEFLFMNLFSLTGIHKKVNKYNFLIGNEYYEYYNEIDYYLDTLMEQIKGNYKKLEETQEKIYYKKEKMLFLNIEKKELINEKYIDWSLYYNNLFFYFDYNEIIKTMLKFNRFEKIIKGTIEGKDALRKNILKNYQLVKESTEELKGKKISKTIYQLDLKMQKILNLFIKDSIISLYKNYYLYDKQEKLKYFWNHLFLALNESLYYYLYKTEGEDKNYDEDELGETAGIDKPYYLPAYGQELNVYKLITNYGLIDELEEEEASDDENNIYSMISSYINQGITDINLLSKKGLKLDFTLSEIFSYDLYINYADYYSPVFLYEYYIDDQSVNQLKIYDTYDEFKNLYLNEVEIGYDDYVLNLDSPTFFDEIENQFDSGGFLYSEKRNSFDSIVFTNYKIGESNISYLKKINQIENYNNITLINLYQYLKNNINIDIKVNDHTFLKKRNRKLIKYDKNYHLNLKLIFLLLKNFKLEKKPLKKSITGKYFFYTIIYYIYFLYLIKIQNLKVEIKIKNILILLYNSYFFYILIKIIQRQYKNEKMDLIFLKMLQIIEIDDNSIKYLIKMIEKFIYNFSKSLYEFDYKMIFIIKYKKLIDWSLKKNVLRFFFKFFDLKKIEQVQILGEVLLKKEYINKLYVNDFNKYISTISEYIKKDKKYHLRIDEFLIYYIENLLINKEEISLDYFKRYDYHFFFEKYNNYLNLNKKNLYDYIEYSDNDLDVNYYDDDINNYLEEDFMDTDEWAYGRSTGFVVGDVSDERIDDELYNDEQDYPSDKYNIDEQTDLEEFDFLFDLDEGYKGTETYLYDVYDSQNDYNIIPKYLEYDRFSKIYNGFLYKNVSYLREFLFKILNEYRKKTLRPNTNYNRINNKLMRGRKKRWINKKGYSKYDSKINLKEVFQRESFINFDHISNSIFEKLIIKYSYVSNYLDFFDYLNELSEENFEFDNDYFGNDINNLIGFNKKTLYNDFYIELYKNTYFNKLLDMFKYFILSYNYLNFIDSKLKIYNTYINFFFELKIQFLKNLNYIYLKYNYINYKLIKYIFNKTYLYNIHELKKSYNFYKNYNSINNKDVLLTKYIKENKEIFSFLQTSEDFLKIKKVIEYLNYIDGLYIFNFTNFIQLLKKIFLIKRQYNLNILTLFYLIKYFELYVYFNNIEKIDLMKIFKQLIENLKNYDKFLDTNSYILIQIFSKYGLHELLNFIKNKQLMLEVQQKIEMKEYYLFNYLLFLYQLLFFFIVGFCIIILAIQWVFVTSDYIWPYYLIQQDEARLPYQPAFFHKYFDYVLLHWGFRRLYTSDNDIIFDPWFFF